VAKSALSEKERWWAAAVDIDCRYLVIPAWDCLATAV
jgi:hypothetical protein